MTKKVKLFLHTFFKSIIPQSDFYHHLLRTKFKTTLKYYLCLVFLLNLILFVFIFIKFSPQKILRFKQSLVQSLNNFPNNLNITVKNGFLITSYDRPYFLWTDFDHKKILLLVIDESAAPEKIEEYKSYILLTNNNFVIRKPKMLIYPLKNINLFIDKNYIQSLMANIENFRFFSILFILSLGFIFLLPLFVSVIQFIYLFILSSLVFLFTRFFMRGFQKLHLLKMFQFTLHSSTVPLILYYFFSIYNFQISFTPWFTFLVILFLLVAIYEAYYEETKLSKAHHAHYARLSHPSSSSHHISHHPPAQPYRKT